MVFTTIIPMLAFRSQLAIEVCFLESMQKGSARIHYAISSAFNVVSWEAARYFCVKKLHNKSLINVIFRLGYTIIFIWNKSLINRLWIHTFCNNPNNPNFVGQAIAAQLNPLKTKSTKRHRRTREGVYIKKKIFSNLDKGHEHQSYEVVNICPVAEIQSNYGLLGLFVISVVKKP